MIIFRKILVAIAALASFVTAGAHAATSITYTGSTQLSKITSNGFITANYSITTDGSLGSINQQNVSNFTLSLTSGKSVIHVPTSTTTLTLNLLATKSTLSFADNLGLIFLATNSSATQNDPNISFDLNPYAYSVTYLIPANGNFMFGSSVGAPVGQVIASAVRSPHHGR